MSEITVEKVKEIAKLIKLNVGGEEERFADLFNQTLDYIKILDELDTSKVDPTYQVTGLTNVYQEPGESCGTLDQQDVLRNAKEQTNNLFVTSAVFNRE